MSRFSDRLEIERYEDDPALGVGLCDRTPGDDAVWIPERIMARIVALGRAYELHLLPMVGWHERTHFNSQLVDNFEDELMFVLKRVDDPLVQAHGRRLVELVARGAER